MRVGHGCSAMIPVGGQKKVAANAWTLRHPHRVTIDRRRNGPTCLRPVVRASPGQHDMSDRSVSHEESDSARGASPHRGTVLVDLPCAQCGYDVKGLPVDGKCPECGFAIRPTVRAYVNPESGHMPTLDHPRIAGLSAAALAVLLLLSALALWTPDIINWRQLFSQGTATVTNSPPENNLPFHLTAIVLVLLAVLATFGLALSGQFPQSRTRVITGLARARLVLVGIAVVMAVGAVADSVDLSMGFMRPVLPLRLAQAASNWINLALGALAIMLALALRPVMEFLAQRSRRHRTGASSRQGIPALIVALSVIMIGEGALVLDWLLVANGVIIPGQQYLTLVAPWLTVIGCVMLTIGLMNLVWDTLRIQRGLARHLYEPEDIIG